MAVTHAELSFSPADSEIKTTDGFSLETCRSMIALMDVSSQLAWTTKQKSLMLPVMVASAGCWFESLWQAPSCSVEPPSGRAGKLLMMNAVC